MSGCGFVVDNITKQDVYKNLMHCATGGSTVGQGTTPQSLCL